MICVTLCAGKLIKFSENFKIKLKYRDVKPVKALRIEKIFREGYWKRPKLHKSTKLLSAIIVVKYYQQNKCQGC